MIQRRSSSRRWHEPARIGLVVTWTLTVTYWFYFQILFLENVVLLRDRISLDSASVLLTTAEPLWYACWFPTLAFGLSWYGFIQRPVDRPTDDPLRSGAVWRARFQRNMLLCTGASLLLLCWRVLSAYALTAGILAESSRTLFAFHWGWDNSWSSSQVLWLFALIGLLGCGLIYMQLLVLVDRFNHGRRTATVLAGVLAIAGLLIPWSGLLYKLPLPVNGDTFSLNTEGALYQGLLLDEDDYQGEARLAVITYLQTHDDDGQKAEYRHLLNDFIQDRQIPADDSDFDYSTLNCEVCRLPVVAGWTVNGLAVRLTDQEPVESLAPALVLEIPRRATDCRVYDPRDLSTFVRKPLAELPGLLAGVDWIVLKLDVAVKMVTVREILSSLEEMGIRRIDLAVLPHGIQELPPDPPLLILDGNQIGARYVPLRRAKGGPLRKYEPPFPKSEDLGKGCESFWPHEYNLAWWYWKPDPPGTVPTRVSIAVKEDEPYAVFAYILYSAMAGEAKEIDLVVEGKIDEEP